MKKILVPCDFSEPSQAAFQVSVDVARCTGGSVLCIHIIDIPILYESAFGLQPVYLDDRMVTEMIKNAEERFQRMMELSNVDNVPCAFKVLQGAVVSTIQRECIESSSDLIIMGMHGISQPLTAILGSITEKVVRSSTVPVLSIRNKFSIDTIKQIVVPTDMSLGHRKFVDQVSNVRDFFGGLIHLLYINTPANFASDNEIRTSLNEYIEHHNFPECTKNIRSDYTEEMGIRRFCSDVNADLIMMETHGRGGIAHLFKGSVTEDVVGHIDVPIWTFAEPK